MVLAGFESSEHPLLLLSVGFLLGIGGALGMLGADRTGIALGTGIGTGALGALVVAIVYFTFYHLRNRYVRIVQAFFLAVVAVVMVSQLRMGESLSMALTNGFVIGGLVFLNIAVIASILDLGYLTAVRGRLPIPR